MTTLIPETGLAALHIKNGLAEMGITEVKVRHTEDYVHDLTKSEDDPKAIEESYMDNFFPEQEESVGISFVQDIDNYWPGYENKQAVEILKSAVEEFQLTFPEGHPKHKQVITWEDVRLNNYYEPFFIQLKSSLDEKFNKKIVAGSLPLDLEDTYDRLLFTYHMFGPDAEVVGAKVDKYVKGNAKYVLIFPEAEKTEKRSTATNSIKATTLLDETSGLKKDKLVPLAVLLGITGYDPVNPEVEDIRTAIMNEIILENKFLSKYQMLGVDLLLEYAIKKRVDLEKMANVMRGLEYNLIIDNSGIYRLASTGEEIPNSTTLKELQDHFISKSAGDLYNRLKDEVTTVTSEVYGTS